MATTPKDRRAAAAFALLFAALVLGAVPGFAEPAPAYQALDWSLSPLRPAFGPVEAKAAVLVEVGTGTVFYAQEADLSLAPASLVKIIVMRELLDEVAAGRLSLSQDVPLPPEAWARNAPPRSSLMFLGPGQRASLDDILAGLAVPSGNDAAAAAAILVSGSVPAFVDRLNQRLAREGYAATRLADASGYSDDNRTSARDFAAIARGYLAAYPWVTERYHAQKTFAYPRPENLLPGHREGAVVQSNYNRLLWSMPEADGLKTGTTPLAGYNLAATALRRQADGYPLRLVAVVLGVEEENSARGNEKRARVAQGLLEYGFSSFRYLTPPEPPAAVVELFGATERFMELKADDSWLRGLIVPIGAAEGLFYRLAYEERILAPVAAGAALGRLELLAGDQIIAEATLRAPRAAAKGGFFRRAWDGIRALFGRLAGKPAPRRPEELSW